MYILVAEIACRPTKTSRNAISSYTMRIICHLIELTILWARCECVSTENDRPFIEWRCRLAFQCRVATLKKYNNQKESCIFIHLSGWQKKTFLVAHFKGREPVSRGSIFNFGFK